MRNDDGDRCIFNVANICQSLTCFRDNAQPPGKTIFCPSLADCLLFVGNSLRLFLQHSLHRDENGFVKTVAFQYFHIQIYRYWKLVVVPSHFLCRLMHGNTLNLETWVL